MRVLIINDFIKSGGAELVYRTSIEILSSVPGVTVATFDETNLSAPAGFLGRIWNREAARELQSLIERFQPQHVWVHNYHNNLSSAILPVISRLRQRVGFRTYLTCHDYFLVFYDPALVYRTGRKISPVPLSDLGSLRALLKRSSAKGMLHDQFKKLHWHLIDRTIEPRSVFDTIFCPSPFMREVLAGRGIDQTVYLPNPLGHELKPMLPTVFDADAIKLAFVGRIVRDKGLDGFLELAEGAGFPQIETITIFGEGEERPRLEQKYRPLITTGKLGFAGNLPHNRLFPALRRCDAVVLPSIWYENAPLVVVEAAMLGLPILVHDIGSLTTFANETGNKILYQNSRHSLEDAMRKLISHRRTRSKPYDVGAFDAARYVETLRKTMNC